MSKLKVITIVSVLLLGTNASATNLNDISAEVVKQKDMLVNHISMQVEKTKKYQINVWADGNSQLKDNWTTIKSWFKRDKEE